MTDHDLREQITKLNRIGIALSSETNLDRLLDLIVREVREFTHADAGSIYIREDEQLRFEVAQNDTLLQRDPAYADSFRPFPLPLTKKSIAGFVALTGRILNLKDVYEPDDSVDFEVNREFDERNNYRTKSMLVVPMLDNRGENIGVLQLINALDQDRQVTSFSAEVEALVMSLASQAAVAIKNAQLIVSIKNLFAALVQYSASAIDARSPHTAGHSRRVATLAQLMAQALNRQKEGLFAKVALNEEELEELSYSAWLHDIGKIGVKEHVLEKANKLSDAILELVRTRFEQIKLGISLECQTRIVELLTNGPADMLAVKAIQEEKDRRLDEIQQDIDFIVKINTPGWMTDEDLARLLEIKNKEFTDGDGQKRPYLDDYEFENLSVRKGNLTDAEYREIQSHVVHTYNIVKNIPFTPELSRIPSFAAAHHEMLNGTGYPNKLQAKDIPLQARILGVVDIYDALVAADRPYKRAMPVDKALMILQEEAKSGRLDKGLVDLFIQEEIWRLAQEEEKRVHPEDRLAG